MYFKHKIYIHCFCLMLFASNSYALSIIEEVKKLFSVKISDDIFDSINKTIVGSLHAKNIRYYFPNRVSMEDVEILDEQGERVLYGKRIEASISLLSLLTKNILVSDALVESPFFRYTIKDKIHSIIRVFESPPSAPKEDPKDKESKFRVTIAHVRVKNGTYEMTHDVGLSIIAEGIQAEGNFWVEKGPFGVDIPLASISRGNISVAGMDLPISDLSAQNLWISDEKVSTSHLKAYYERALLDAEGTVFIKEERYSLNARLNAPKNTYPRGLKKLPFVPPKIIADIIMLGTLTEPEFSITAKLGETDFNGLSINSGTLAGTITTHRIAVESSVLEVGDKAKIVADGIVDIDKERFSFATKEYNLSSNDLLKFLSLDFASSGRINAATTVAGSFSADAPMDFVSSGQLSNASLDKAYFAPTTHFHTAFTLRLPKDLTFDKIVVSDNQGLKIEGHGTIALADKGGTFSYKAQTTKPEYYIANWLPKALKTEHVQTTGAINWTPQEFGFSGSLTAKKLEYEKALATNLKTNYEFQDSNLKLSTISGDLYQGKAYGFVEVKDIKNQQSIKGQLEALDVDLTALGSKFSDIALSGKTTAYLSLSGTMKKPQANFDLISPYLSIDKIDFKNIELQGSYYGEKLELSQLHSSTNSGRIDGIALSYNLKTQAIAGSLSLSEISLAPLLFKYNFPVEAFLNGPVKLGGTWRLPEIHAPLTVKNLIVKGQKFGSGPLALSLKKEKLADTSDEDVVFSLSSLLKEGPALSDIRFSMALERRTINSTLSLSDFPLDTSLIAPGFNLFGLKGRIFAHISSEGPLAAPRLTAEATLADYSFFDPRRRNSILLVKKKHGPATLKASLNNGKLALDLCAPFDIGQAGKDCHFDKGLSLTMSGPFSLNEFSLNLTGALDYNRLEEILPLLNDELATVDIKTHMQGKLIKQKNKDLNIDLKLYFDRIFASLPNTPHINLNKPVSMNLNNNGISIDKEVIFTFSPGQMIISGDILHDNLNINVAGAIPLVFTKFFVPMIQRGDGLAVGDLNITGPLSAPLLDGYIAPEKGATLSFKKWIESVEFKEGTIKLFKTSPFSFEGQFSDIKLGIGDGRLAINGRMKKRYKSPTKSELMTFDVRVEGSNVIIRDKNDFIEADFKLDTIKPKSAESVLSGKIAIIDGSAYRQFDLRNFVIQAAGQDGAGVGKSLENVDLRLDVDIAVRQFKAAMRMLNIDVDALLTGQLKAQGQIARPKFTGALAVSEGTVNFPAASFDLGESRIELDELSDKPFDPKISIVSTQEFEKDFYPVTQDSTIELSLKGNLDKLNLELKPISGDMRLSQTKIFMMLLSPRGTVSSGEKVGMIQNAKNAAVAFTGEYFLRPLTNELQNFLEGTTKTRMQFGTSIEPGGVTIRLDWKIGPRIELQGSYMFITEDIRAPKDDQLSFGNYPFRDLKLKLLLFDHRPLGPLFFESSFGANRYIGEPSEPRAKVRLNYRVLSR